MEKISIKEYYKPEIDDLWKKFEFHELEILKRGYAIQDEIILQSILFIGINPSYSEKQNLSRVSHFYNNDQVGKIYSYFKKFQEISKKTKIPWAHIDLLHIRETNQKSIKKLNRDPEISNFIIEQLNISKKIIEKSNPKIIVVSNSYARLLFKTCFETEFDDKLGTYKIINHPGLQNVPVFFTSMLTGQRALDLGSYCRLIWHINFVKNK